MITTDLNRIRTLNKIPISELGEFLKQEGFNFVKQFSTDEYRIFVSSDAKFLIVLERNLGKVYSTANQKKALHYFSVIK